MADMGIMIGDKSQWRKGVGLDAWSTLLNYLLSQPKIIKVTGGTLRPNKGMVNVMIRAGMYLDTVKNDIKMHQGNLTDVLQYAKCSDERPF